MYSKYGHPEDDYVAVLDRNLESGNYTIFFYHGEMPPFGGKTFNTLAQAKSWAKEELGITRWRGFDGRLPAVPG